MFQEILDEKPKIIYSSHGKDDIPKELEHLEYDDSNDYGITTSKKKEIVKFQITKAKIAKLKKQYRKRMRRYKVYEYKWPKNRDPRLTDEPFLISSNHMIQKYQLHDMIAPEEETDTDN